MNFLINWAIFYLGIMIAMCIDNLFWISSSPEYETFKKMKLLKKEGNFILINEKTYYTKIKYIFAYRILSVLKDPRDILPGLISSLLLTITFTILKFT